MRCLFSSEIPIAFSQTIVIITKSRKKLLEKKGEGVLICIVNIGSVAGLQAFAIVGISVISAVMSMS